MTAPLFPDLVVNGETVPHASSPPRCRTTRRPRASPASHGARPRTRSRSARSSCRRRARAASQPEPAEVGPGRFETEEEALIRGLLDAAVDRRAAVRRGHPRRMGARPVALPRAAALGGVAYPRRLRSARQGDARGAPPARSRTCRAGRREPGIASPALRGEHSDCGSKASGGALGQLGPGDTVPEFEAALRKLGDGEITAEPVLTRHGWHVIRMDAGRRRGAAVRGRARPHRRGDGEGRVDPSGAGLR